MKTCLSFISYIVVIVIWELVKRVFHLAIDDCSNSLFNKVKERLLPDFSWYPEPSLKNEREAYENINNFPKDIKWDIEYNKISFEEFVEGEIGFKQHLIKFIHTERGKYVIYPKEYGNEQAETIFLVKNSEEFKRQCQYMIDTILKHDHFQKYIQEFYGIKRKNGDLYIEFKVYGKPDTLICRVPSGKHIGNKRKQLGYKVKQLFCKKIKR